MLTEKDYCDYDTCVALKELGFCPTSTTSWSIEGRLIVHLYDAQKWLREKKFLLIVVDRLLHGEYEFSIVDILNYSEEKNGTANSYEEALSEGIKEAIKILKNQ